VTCSLFFELRVVVASTLLSVITLTTGTMSSVNPNQQEASPNPQKAIKPMASKPAKVDGDQRASWSIEDEDALIQFLVEHRAEAGNGFNFKTKTFNAASIVVNAMRTKGGTKTWRVCKNKWTQVCSVCYIGRTAMTVVAFLIVSSA
jgi:hypothetical protein